jgi:hypothetical protein
MQGVKASREAAMKRRSTWLLGIAPLLLVCGCSKKQVVREEAAPPQQAALVDRHADTYLEPQKVLHQIFPVKDHTQFAFSIPPHQRDARLIGNFRSFAKRGAPDSTSDQTADVDLMVLDDQQLDDFLHSRPVTATYEVDPSHNQKVEWKAPPTSDQPQAYHLVFSNSAGGAKVKFVDADFAINFE